MKTELQNMGKTYRIIARQMLERIGQDLCAIGIREFTEIESRTSIRIRLPEKTDEESCFLIVVFPAAKMVEVRYITMQETEGVLTAVCRYSMRCQSPQKLSKTMQQLMTGCRRNTNDRRGNLCQSTGNNHIETDACTVVT